MADMVQTDARSSLSRLVGWGVLGQLCYVASQFLLLVALARHASVEDVGRFGLVSAIILPVYWFFNLGVRANQATDARGAHSFHEFLALRFLASLLAYGLVVALALLAVDPAARMVMLVFGAAKGAETYCELCYGAFQKAERMPYVATSLILRGAGGTAMFWLLISTSDSLPAAYGGILAVWAMVAFGIDLPRALRLSRNERRPIQLSKILKLALHSLPLALNALLSALQGSTPRYLTSYLLGLAALGQFTVVGYAMQAATTLTNAVGQSIIARLSQYAASGEQAAFLKVLKKILMIIALCSIGSALIMLAIGDPLLKLVFGAEYAALGDLLALMMIAAGASAAATLLQSGLLATRRFNANLWIRAASFCVLAAAAAAGATVFGLPGVVGGVFIGSLVQSALLAAALLRQPMLPAQKVQS